MDPRPFGGKCILLGGDVKQLLPVASGRVEQIELFFTNYRFWRVFQVVHLMTNMRVNAGGEDFTRWLEDLGRGTTNTQIVKDKDTKDGDFVNLPDRCLTVDVVREIYGQLHALTPQQLAQRAILCPKNEHCNLLNDKILESFTGKTFVIHSNDSVASGDEDEVANFPEEYLNSITPSGMPHHKLKLKVGVPVILLRNLCLEDGLINGTRLLVLAVTDMLITAEIVTGRFCGRRVLIPRMDLTSSDQNLPFVLKRRQFPLKLCFALTINKAQGQTFERVGIYLASPVFSHGQLYVAFSRARSWDSVKVEVVKTKHQGYLLKSSKKVFTKNIVFGNILNSIQNE
ncbi:ATP-dependent DNA helicase PIF1-like [Coccinella septempunctata]|uniref:ATP-dependent DNA helicase PIF1-like n=1 Tax=Coccinella septempunctata TaxID=41139 RepID=UPI001D05CFDC|nr:ATP-dependent DNA helicase PIF1-like [Coccinella septempunctata]